MVSAASRGESGSAPARVQGGDTKARPAPLTEAQEGLWYAQAMDPDSPILNTGQYVELLGPLDLAAFETAHEAAVAQSLALSLRFGTRDGRPAQWQGAAPGLEVVDLRDRPETEAETEALAAMATDSATPVALEYGPAARFVLYRIGPERAFWYERIHHLAIDGFGIVLFTNRVAELYSAETGARKAPAPFPPLDRMMEEDAAYRASDRRAEDADFWRQELAALDAVAGPAPTAPGRALSAHRFDRTRLDLGADLRDALRARAKTAGVSWPDLLTVLTAAYFARVSGEGEQVFALPYMARMGTGVANLPCTWMNVLPFRHAPDEDRPLDEVLAEASAHLSQIRRHGRYRSEQLRRDLRRTAIDARIFAPLINVQPFDLAPRFAGLTAHLHILGAGAVDDMTATFRGDAVRALSLEIDSNPERHTRDGAAAHATRLASFLRAALGAETLADIPTVTPAEERRLLHDLNATDHPVAETTLTALIEAQMLATPEAPAVISGDTLLSYADLDRRSAALAGELRRRGAGPGKVVAVALPRSEHLAVAMIAVQRAGAAYVPLDPADPAERLARLAERTEAVALLADPGCTAGALRPLAPADWPTTGTAPDPGTGPDDLAYILFTSGSTGEPKGVMIEHRAIVNRLLWMRDHYGFGPADRILQKTPITFDVSVWELFLPALCGAVQVMAPPGAHGDPAALAGLIADQGVTTAHFVPSMLAAFLDDPAADGLRMTRVFCSGEALTAALRDRFHRRIGAELHNLYGPTEAAVDVTFWNAGPDDRSDPLPIGHPVRNTKVQVLDARMRLLPEGVPGELFLGGVQLARGYLGRADLTAERFRPDPFRPGERLYATGDRAVLRPGDGAVVYVGRTDHQVKIRGMRVEPGEIEGALRDLTGLREVLVIPRELGGETRLVAYAVTDGAALEPEPLRARLAARLPGHMVPAAIVALERWPLSPSGKLDRRALPDPVTEMPTGTAPRGKVEEALAALFRELLHLPEVPAREADFFALGGDSLKAVRLSQRIAKDLHRDPGLGQIFETPTVAGLTRAIDMAEEARTGLGPLLPLRHDDSGRAPLFILHPAGGLGWGYRRLARALDPARPVRAVQAPAMEGAALPETLGAMAEDYAARVASVRPEGMLHLAGWSVGGILAQEIAVTLRARGREVGLVALLDAYPAECWRAEPEPDPAAALRALLAIAGHDPDAHPELESRAAVVAFLRRGGTALGSLPAPVLDAVVRLVTGTNRLIRAHEHRYYDGTLTHLRAARDHAGRGLRAALWEPHAARVEAIDLPFLHPEMISDPAARRIAPLLSERMVRMERSEA
ncbi:amino acid adenylation domain-containing protein [Aquicoccus sp. SCR17]|nr:amino acid adenylation domain-containing protein [Carideicomes alvinocaridis]